MPYLKQPSIKTLQNGKKAISFTRNFVGEPMSSLSLGGFVFTGASFFFDPSSISGGGVGNPIEIKSLQFSVDFDASSLDSGGNDGEFVIFIPATNQLIRFAANGFNPGTNTANSRFVTSACIPIVAPAPSQFIFAKGEDATAAMFGTLSVTMFDFEQGAYVNQGYSVTR